MEVRSVCVAAAAALVATAALAPAAAAAGNRSLVVVRGPQVCTVLHWRGPSVRVTWRDAGALAPVPVRRPAYLPVGYRLQSMVVTDPRTSNGSLTVRYARHGREAIQLGESQGLRPDYPWPTRTRRLDGASAWAIRLNGGSCVSWVTLFYPPDAVYTVMGRLPVATLERVAASLRRVRKDA